MCYVDKTTVIETLHRNRQPRRAALALTLVVAALSLAACGGATGPTSATTVPPPALSPDLSASQVQSLVVAAAQAADVDTMVIAVSDRAGQVLAIYRKPSAPATTPGNFGAAVDTNELAVSLARTAAFFSNDQAPISSRSVRFLSGIHFPPGVAGSANAPLYAIENSNRGCALSSNFLPGQSISPPTALDGVSPSLGIATGKADLDDSDPTAVNPGGVPIFESGVVVGGIGVAGVAPDVAEFAAYAAATSNGFGFNPAAPGAVVIGGITVPFVDQTTQPTGTTAGTADGAFLIGPTASPAQPPENYLVGPNAGPHGGLSASEVNQIIMNAVATANTTRAVLRLPEDSTTEMVIAVADLDGTIIGLYRMPDSTVFSIDVSATKARNMVYFNSVSRTATDLEGVPIGTAVTSRTIGYGAQPLFPPGIDGTNPGPFFNLFQQDTAHPCTQGFQPPGPNQSGVVFFPGSVPLYLNGVLVGGLGVSGDGVDQDDYVAAGGGAGYEAPAAIRADQISIDGVTLPYQLFPRNPTN
ncbi:MAG: heme-binding protein [Candidatus Acidiferrales bacterium]